jgi:HK97 gp10 family phage protein
MRVDVEVKGLAGVLDTLKSLPPEIVSKRGGPVKAALRKGARVIWQQAKANLQVATSNASYDGKRYSTGLLLKNLVVTRGKKPTGTNGERYLVRVRRKSYPDRNGGVVTTLASANLLEYGSQKQPPEPWLRPAFQSKAEQAIKTTEAELLKQIDRVVAKLAQRNKGK